MILDLLTGPWHWAVSGIGIVMVMFLLTWMGTKFGVSTIFENLCTLGGAGKKFDYLNIDLQGSGWRFAFVIGSVVGGAIAGMWMMPQPLEISEATLTHLSQDYGWSYPQGGGLLPDQFFNLGNLKAIVITLAGGFLVGFGARYAGGCTSGHAITGMSHLQLPSFLTVIGFFLGGLIMTWLIMPVIFNV